MSEQYPDVRYSKESSAFIMAIAALQRANGVPLDAAIEHAIAVFWQYQRAGTTSLDLEGLRGFIRHAGAPPR